MLLGQYERKKVAVDTEGARGAGLMGGTSAHAREATVIEHTSAEQERRAGPVALTDAELDQVSGGHAVLFREQGTTGKPQFIIVDEVSLIIVPGEGPVRDPR